MRLAHCVSLVWLGLVSGFNGNSLANSHPKDLTEDSGSLEALRKVYEIDEIKDLGILTQLPQRNLEKVSSDQPELAIGQIVELKLPKEGKLLSTITHLFEADENLHVEMQVQEDPMSNIHLVLNSRDHRLSGSLFVGGNSYFVHHEGRKTFLLEQNDLEYEGPNPTIPRVAELMKTGLHPLNAITTTTSDKFVDVMILYTDDVAANSNAEETLRSRVDSVNSMLAESCANFRYRLVYIGSISYVETGNTSTDLSQLTNSSDGQIDSVHTLRDTYGADLVQLVTSTGSACGLAYLSQKDYYNEAYGFSVTNYWCNAKTMAHEWGHNLGSEHDRYERGVQKNQETLSLTGYGFVDLLNKYLDIMAYPDQCNDAGVSCTAINRFSNPRIFHNGVAFGIENYSNSVQRMDEAFPYIANFRTAVSSYEPDIKPSCVGKSDNKDLHCFIATAAYGSYLQPHVKILREFRDQVLKTHSLGRSFVRVYYEYSPSLARWIEASPLMAKMVRFLIYLLVLGIQYWMVLSIGLLILFISILALRASVKAWVSGFLIICFVVGRIQNVEAQVSTSSRIYSDRVTNPSVRLLLKPSSWLGAAFSTQKSQFKAPVGYLEENDSQIASLQVGNFSSDFFYELGLSPEFTTNKKVVESGYSDVKMKSLEQDFYLQAGMRLFEFPFGLRFSQTNILFKELGVKENRQSLTAGFSGNWGENFRWGIGADAINEYGESVATSRWIEPFVGLATGSFLGEAPVFLELSFKRRPQVLNFSDEKLNVHSESLLTDISFEYASKAGIWPFNPLIFRVEYLTEEEKKMDVYVLETKKITTTKIKLGSSFFVPSLYWAIGYLTRVSAASSFDYQGSEWTGSVFWSSGDTF